MNHSQLERTFRDALAVWEGTGNSRWARDALFRVHPGAGFPQTGTHLTAFATALFAEVVAELKETCCNARVAYRGVTKADQPKLHDLFRKRHADARLVVREALTLDFATVHRAEPHHPHTVHIALESEMLPITGKGSDPDLLAPDLAKLCLLHTGPKFYLCRMNGGREKRDGKLVPKSERVLQVLRGTLEFAATLPALGGETLAALFVIETAQELPGRVHTLVLEPADAGRRVVTARSFDVQHV